MARKNRTLLCLECKLRFETRRKYQIFCSLKCFSVNLGKRIRKTNQERFLSKIYKKSDCWIWKGFVDKDGYGTFCLRNKDGSHQNERAHRASWILKNGKIPGNLYILHKCDNPSCVRPSHLFLGTAKDNYTDSASKKRNIFGERNPSSKLTEENVRYIRSFYTGKRGQVPFLSRKFNVSVHPIWMIVKNRTWKHLL